MFSAFSIFRVFIPFALGYFLSYLYRVVNAVIAPDLSAEIGLGAADLGLLTSAYFLTFALFQLPLGMLLDAYGPRKTEATLLLFAAAGAFVFVGAETTGELIAGRALIGLGVSSCLMAAFKAFVTWVPKERLPLANGFQMGAGGLGALSGTIPVEAALSFTDWRGVFLGLGIATLFAAALIFFVVPKRAESAPPGEENTVRQQMGGIAHIFSSPAFWWIAPLAVSSQAAFLAIQTLWVGPWLRDVSNLDRTDVANFLFAIAAAMVAGFILSGIITDKLRKIGVKPITISLYGMSACILIQAIIVSEVFPPIPELWPAFSFFGTTGILVYAALSQKFPSHLAGRLNTGLNLLVFISAFALQWGTGIIIEMWPMGPDGGNHPQGYQAALGFILALQVVSLIWIVIYQKGRTTFNNLDG